MSHRHGGGASTDRVARRVEQQSASDCEIKRVRSRSAGQCSITAVSMPYIKEGRKEGGRERMEK